MTEQNQMMKKCGHAEGKYNLKTIDLWNMNKFMERNFVMITGC